MEYFERIIDINTGEETIRPFTADEIAAHKASEKALAEEVAAIKAAEAEKQAEKERIAQALGLTLDELKVLLG